MKRAAIDVIETAYQTGGETEDWLRAIAKAMPVREHGAGYVCATFHIEPTGHLVFGDLIQHDAPGDLVSPMRAAPPETHPPDYVALTYAIGTCGSALRVGPPKTRAHTRAELGRTFGPFGVRDLVVVNAIDPTRHGVFIGGMVTREAELPARESSTWRRVAAHLAASYRLRRAPAAEPDAVITPAGKIEHAIDDARSTSARESLRRAALAIDKAKTRRARIQEGDAVEMWQALVNGHWTLVDRVDSDGRRYLIARRNDPDVAPHYALTRRERQVVEFTALGHSNKLIGYELGLSVSAVAVYLDIAMAKLGVTSRADLIVAARAFGSGDR